MAKIQREFKNQLSEKEILKTTAGAINSTAKRVLTQVKTLIKKEGYTMNKKYLDRMATVKKPAKGTTLGLYANIAYSYKPVPIIGFKHKGGETTKKINYKNRKPIIIEIKKGKSVMLKHAFIATMKSGHKGMFGLGAYKGAEFKQGGKKVTELRTASPFTMATNKQVEAKLMEQVKERMPKTLHAMLQNKVNRLTK